MTPVADVDANTIIALVGSGLVGTAGTLLVKAYLAPSRKNAVVVSSAQGANVMLEGLNKALKADYDRVTAERESERRQRIELEEENVHLRREIERLGGSS